MSAGGMQAGVGGATVTAGKITTDDVINTSTVPGATATDAFNSLSGSIGALTTDDIANASGVAGATCSDALDTLDAAIPSPSGATPQPTAAAGSAGASGDYSRADHVHASPQLTATAPVNVTKAAAAVGVATDAARADHKHDVSTAAPVSVGTANSEGSATTLARSDHVHASQPFIVQSMEINRSTSTSTSSSSYSSLVSGSITLTAGRFLCFTATVSVRISGIILGAGETFVEIRFNGTSYRSAAQTIPGNNMASMSITGRVAVGSSGLVAGSNTIELRWRNINGTANVNPASDGEHATIQLIEMSA